jgi:hypothetical protein
MDAEDVSDGLLADAAGISNGPDVAANSAMRIAFHVGTHRPVLLLDGLQPYE